MEKLAVIEETTWAAMLKKKTLFFFHGRYTSGSEEAWVLCLALMLTA